MKLLFSLLITACAIGCATSNERPQAQLGTTTLNIWGAQGTQFTGFYVHNGKRSKLANAVPSTPLTSSRRHYNSTSTMPFSFVVDGLSEAEIRKVNPAESLTVEAHWERAGTDMTFSTTAGPGVPGVRVQVRNGLSVRNL